MQLEFFDVPSPCIGICQSDDKGYCMGCFRTREERQNWIDLTTDDKQKVVKRCQQRKKRKENKGTKVAAPDSAQSKEPEIQPSLLDQPSRRQLDKSNDLDFGDFEL
ncbi:DUF1289 domain-containing protein [Thalassotalea fusca]